MQKKDIKRCQSADKATKIWEDYNKAVFENIGIAIVIIKKDGTIFHVNNEFENLCGYSKEEIEGKKSFEKFLLKEKVEKVRIYDILRYYNSCIPPKTYKTCLVHKKGNILDVYLTLNLLSYTDKLVVTIQDITKLKKTEADLKICIKEKEVLLRELNHRVRNNLQMIYSLLNLEKSYLKEEEAIKLLQSTQNRLKAMIYVYNMVHEVNNLSVIDFSVYIQKLVLDLFHVYDAKNNIKPMFNIDQIFFNIETVIPCGFIVSEIVYNIIKYAFPNNETGKITLDFHSYSDEEFKLIISSNGKSIDFNNKNSFGLALIKMLVKQLDSSLEIDNNPGTTFKIKFKELNYAERR
ncbi:histidine kinase dimerization/phosphoacceptor domain -containing protein [Methanobacterium paludis]|uniref:histidine kinase n=1 Tax=Methanobacterium paludis (strain DSM 25820 / JCM 18151 / SWAN1) TaxID=868131 RepID=F6D4U9_METPW|nr:histidine kinase dimerization/phosphoacceptor domain -containing protein [Methanobacterium paludis]AEG18158.1 signal transduction histidine kinase [Methanobacterium paludis]